jgi:hypothetical protein
LVFGLFGLEEQEGIYEEWQIIHQRDVERSIFFDRFWRNSEKIGEVDLHPPELLMCHGT